jgi:hypothetical protein
MTDLIHAVVDRQKDIPTPVTIINLWPLGDYPLQLVRF